jgi:RNA polymerase sigma-70 factor, ECF subfamily
VDAAAAPGPERLLALARQGRADCLGTLLELYRNYLHLLARTQIDLHLRGGCSASDMVQETFLQACGHFAQFRGGSEHEFLGWLRRILLNNLGRLVERELASKRDARRRVSLQNRLHLLEQSSANFEAALASRGSSPSERAQHREVAALVADQLARLPQPYRDVIVLRNLEGSPFEEVGRRMGRTAGAVRALWLRALDQLQTWWQGRTAMSPHLPADGQPRSVHESAEASRVMPLLEAYLAELERGARPDPEALIARHPELAGPLRAHLDKLDMLHCAAGRLRDPEPCQQTKPPGPEAGLGQLGDFRLIREAGRGGMGVVYEAEQLSLGRRVALKVLSFAGALDQRQLQRFKNEAQAAALLCHQNIVPVYGVGRI